MPLPSAVPVPRRSPTPMQRCCGVHRRLASLVLLTSALGGLTLSQLGCSGDTINGPPPIDAAHAYWALQITQPHAINLALTPPYNTVRLSAVAHNPLGTPLSGIGTVVWTAGLDSSVNVDSTGLVTARRFTGVVTTVTARLLDAQQHLTLADTVYIQVTQTATPIRTFSTQPASGDSATRPVFSPGVSNGSTLVRGLFGWYVTAVDSAGDSVCTAANGCGLLVTYGVSDSNIVKIGNVNPTVACLVSIAVMCPTFSPQALGTTYLTATTLAYGQVLRDSVLITIKQPSGYLINLVTTSPNDTVFTAVGFGVPNALTLGAGAVVQWSSYNSGNTVPFAITFDSPPAVPDTASCTVSWTSAYILVLFGRYPPTFAPTGSGDIAPFGADTTGFVGGNNFQVLFTDNGAVTDTTWFINNCRARRFKTPGVYHWHSSLFPSKTFTLTIAP